MVKRLRKQQTREKLVMWGARLVTQYWGGTKHFFLLILYNFKNIGGHVPPFLPTHPPPTPYSAVPALTFLQACKFINNDSNTFCCEILSISVNLGE